MLSYFKLVILGLIAINVTNVFTVLIPSTGPSESFNHTEIIAHRGASWDAPENTLSSIGAALEQDADGVEVDVRMTGDGHVVLMHDASAMRTTDDTSRRWVKDMSLQDVRSLDAGAWFDSGFAGEKVPTLQEVFDLTGRQTTLFIDMKDNSEAINRRVVELIEAYNMEDRVKVMAFSHKQLQDIKALNGDIETVILVSALYGDMSRLIHEEYDAALDSFAFSVDLFYDESRYVDEIRQSGKKVYSWTVNTEDDIHGAAGQDVDGIITDRPMFTRKEIYLRHTSDTLSSLFDFLLAD